jgi:hypothetical protein
MGTGQTQGRGILGSQICEMLLSIGTDAHRKEGTKYLNKFNTGDETVEPIAPSYSAWLEALLELVWSPGTLTLE